MAKPQPAPKPGKHGHGGRGEKWDPKKYNGKACPHGAPIGACKACAGK